MGTGRRAFQVVVLGDTRIGLIGLIFTDFFGGRYKPHFNLSFYHFDRAPIGVAHSSSLRGRGPGGGALLIFEILKNR